MRVELHSPGPWEWEEDYPGAIDKNQLVAADGSGVIVPVAGWDRADLGIRTGTLKQGSVVAEGKARANARLLRAAPDLLAVLSAIEWGGLDRYGRGCCPYCGAVYQPYCKKIHVDGCGLKVALQKAEGGVE